MKYRALSPSGDYVFGQGLSEFLVNSPQAVAQAVQTRLGLFTGEWFLDQTEGTPYAAEILGTSTQPLYDQAIQERIIGTQGVQSLDDYASFLDQSRKLSVACMITTIYGSVAVTAAL